MSILVTGAAGFIGGHVCQEIIKQGYQVIGIDNFDPYYSKNLKERNLTPLNSSSSFRFYQADYSDSTLLSKIFTQDKISCVLHLAARPGVTPSLNNSLEVLKENVEKTLVLLEEMRAHQVKKIIFASSSSIYGTSPVDSFEEELPLKWAISPYATSKQAAELYLRLFHNLHGFSCTSLRFFSVYGPCQRPDMAISKFFKANLEGQPIELYCQGKIERDYTYIDDIVQGIMLSLKQIEQSLPLYRCYNLGNHQRHNLQQLIHFIQLITGKNSTIIYRGPMEGDAPSTCADIKRAQSELGYTPKTTLFEGLKKQYQWLKSLE